MLSARLPALTCVEITLALAEFRRYLPPVIRHIKNLKKRFSMVKLKTAIPRSEYKLFLGYDDGVVGEVDLSHLVGRGVFALWLDPAAFEAVSIGAHSAIHWTDDVELCGDALYLQITGKPVEQLFPNLKAKANA